MNSININGLILPDEAIHSIASLQRNVSKTEPSPDNTPLLACIEEIDELNAFLIKYYDHIPESESTTLQHLGTLVRVRSLLKSLRAPIGMEVEDGK